MAADLKLKRGTSSQVVTSGSAAVAAAARSALSSEFDNQTGLSPYCQAVLVGAFGTAPTDGKRLTLYAIPAHDGSNYADGSDTVKPSPSLVVGWVYVRNTTGTQRLAFTGRGPDGRIALPASKVKFVLANDADQQLSAGWTLDIYPELWQSA